MANGKHSVGRKGADTGSTPAASAKDSTPGPAKATAAETAGSDKVTVEDIREKLEQLEGAASEMIAQRSSVWLLGALLGGAAMLGLAYLAGRRSCR